jgi:aldose sugar dehydrogenase
MWSVSYAATFSGKPSARRRGTDTQPTKHQTKRAECALSTGTRNALVHAAPAHAGVATQNASEFFMSEKRIDRHAALGALFAAAMVCGLSACGGGSSGSSNVAPPPAAAAPPPAPPPPAPAPPAPAPPSISVVAEGLEYPWGLGFLPDGSMLVTERPGRLRLISADGLTTSAPIVGTPVVDARDQGGLLDVAVDPGFAVNRRIYLSYAEPGVGAQAGQNGTAVASAELSTDNTSLNNVAVIFRQTPKVASAKHFGGRLAVAAGGSTLFVTLGERFDHRDEAQNPANTLGKVVRINTDGSIPADNPWVGVPGTRPEIWSLGHRNPQGAAINPATNALWTNEHGPQGGDELNLTQAGRNYGWPLVSYGCEYGAVPLDGCTPVGGASSGAGFEQPLSYWVPTSIAPSGMAFYNGTALPEWTGSVFVGALAGQALWRLSLSGNVVTSREALFTELNERIRDVRTGPDGWLYLLTDNAAGRVLRVSRPQE